MAKYKFNDSDFTEEELKKIAESKGYTLDELFEKNPDINKIDPDPEDEGKAPPSQEITSATVEEDIALEPTVTDSKSEDISSALPKIEETVIETGTAAETDIIDPKDEVYKPDPQKYMSDFVEAIQSEAATGYKRGETITSSMELFNAGEGANAEEIEAWLQDNLPTAEKTLQSSLMKEWQKTYDKLGGGILGWTIATAFEPRVLPAIAAQSTALQIASLKDETVRRNAALGAAGGATLGLATTGGVTSIPNAIIGAFSSGMATVETALTYSELLREAIQSEGIEFTKNNIPNIIKATKAILENPEKLSSLQRKAAGRGVAIGVVEGVTGSLAKGVGSTLFKRGANPLSISTAIAGTGAVGGSLGEIAGMTAAGQDLETSEILFEGFTPGPSSLFATQNLVKNVKTLVYEGEVNNIIEPTEYTNISYAFDPLEKTTDTQVKLSEIPGSVDILDRKVRQEVYKKNITKAEGDAIRENFRETQGATNQVKPLNFNTKQKTKAVELLKEKNQLNIQIEQVGDKALTAPQQERIDAINKELKDLNVERAAETIAAATDASRVIVVENDKELKDKYNIEGANYSVAGGFFQDGKFYINKEIAGTLDTVTEAAHELLHPIIKDAIKKNPQKIIKEFKQVIGKEYTAAVQARIDASPEVYTEQYMADNPDEFITQFSDLIIEEEIQFNENIFTKIGDYFTPLLRSLGFKKIKFNTGKDVYNFMREYTRNIKEGQISEDVQAVIPTELTNEAVTFSAKSLAPEVTTDAENRIVELQKLKEETTAVAEKFNKEYSPSANEQKLQKELLNIIDPVISKVAENRTKALYDKIPAEQKENVNRKDYKESLKNNLAAMAVNEFTKGKQDLEAFIVNRGYLRANALAKQLGIESTEEFGGPGITLDITETADIAAEPAETAQPTTEQGKKLVSKTLDTEREQKLKDVIRDLELTEDQLTFKALPNAAVEVFAEQIGIPAKKFKGASNFTGDELGKVINFIEENIDIIRQALPEAAVLEGAAVSEALIGTATGVPNNLLKDTNLYTRLARGTKLAGLIPFQKNKGIDNSSILKAIGIVEGKRTAGPRDKQAQTAKGLINVLAKFATNQEVRLQKNLTPQQQTNIETGKGSTVLFSTKDKNKFNKIFKNAPEEVLKYGMLLNVKPTQKAINKVLDKIQEDLAPDAYDEYYKKYFEPYIKFRKFAQKQKWPWAEEKVRDTLAFLSKNNPNLKLKNITLNEDSQKVDIQFELNGELVLVEVKKNYEARISQIYLYEEANGKISTNKTADKIYEDKIIKADKNRNVLINFIKENYPAQIKEEKSKKNNRKVYIATLDAIAAARRRLKAAGIAYETKIEMPIGLAISLYTTKANKAKNVEGLLISFGDLGTFYIGENKMQFPVPSLEQEGVGLTVRIIDKINPRGQAENIEINGESKPTASLSRVAVNTLTKEAVEVLENTPSLSLQNESQAAAIFNTAYSIKQATTKNNNKLPASQKLPKGSTNEQVLAKMRELDNQANEERAAFSAKQNLDKEFNDIIESSTKIESIKRFSPAKAAVRGAKKGKFNFFIPPSAEDFEGLLYKTLGKGKLGDQQMKWYKQNLFNPYARAMNEISSARVAAFQDYETLQKDLDIIPKDLKKKSVDEYNKEQAVRVYIWDQQGEDIPGLFQTDQKDLVKYVNNDPELRLFAEQLIAIQKNDKYTPPKEGWLVGDITTDILDGINSIKRKKYLEQWQANVDEIFSETNLNKLEAAFGKPYRKALEGTLKRMRTGRNRSFATDSLAERVTNWLNNSVGAIMFFNSRSAVLQLLSTINFINWNDNNIYKAGKAFANQPQYWKDFKFLFNSDFLKERRGGLRFNVAESEIADAAKKNGAKGVISKILQAGFLPTQMADSFAIASGGATFYRNRYNTYIKQGLTQAEAKEQAFSDFRETAETAQQSSRPDKISQQQAGPLGRTILAFANTPAQYARLTKKAASDLVNRRGDAKTNLSKLLYYGFVQNLIFNALQQAVFALAFGDSEEEEKAREKKYISVANGMADGILRGIGVQGAIISTLKNTIIKIIQESEKDDPEYSEKTIIELLGVSPPIQSKVKKVVQAANAYEWNKKEMIEKGFSLDNPAYMASANVISAATNVPLDRAVKKVNNITAATRADITQLERMMLIGGWSDWELNIQKPKAKKKKKKKFTFKRSKVKR